MKNITVDKIKLSKTCSKWNNQSFRIKFTSLVFTEQNGQIEESRKNALWLYSFKNFIHYKFDFFFNKQFQNFLFAIFENVFGHDVAQNTKSFRKQV